MIENTTTISFFTRSRNIAQKSFSSNYFPRVTCSFTSMSKNLPIGTRELMPIQIISFQSRKLVDRLRDWTMQAARWKRVPTPIANLQLAANLYFRAQSDYPPWCGD
eukprot:TRINITY_DN26987_c0_g1_i1.p2 TRINITY_DN26987_c0_g1~~TRINITY_DN26987_c0_g1_i1.p2  ORF type:complete len:106 (+),score=18.07 TRINITY_DN26987_c0_g1_i1:278-595(+)